MQAGQCKVAWHQHWGVLGGTELSICGLPVHSMGTLLIGMVDWSQSRWNVAGFGAGAAAAESHGTLLDPYGASAAAPAYQHPLGNGYSAPSQQVCACQLYSDSSL